MAADSAAAVLVAVAEVLAEVLVVVVILAVVARAAVGKRARILQLDAITDIC